MANTNLTISKTKVSNLPLPERTADFTTKFHVDYSDINTGTGSSDTVTLTLATTPATWIVASAMGVITTAFAGTTAFTVTVGTTTNVACILPSQSTLTAGTITSTSGPNTVATTTQCTGTSAISLVAVFTNATGGSPSALTAGALDIYVSLVNPNTIDVSTTG
jgi:hypothetical protein